MNNRSTKLRPGAGLILAGLLAVTLTAYAATQQSYLKIGPNPSTTNIDLQGDGDIIAAGDLDVGGVITGNGSGITGVTGDALTAAFIEALDPATPVAGDLLVGVDATDGELKQFDIDNLPGGGGGDVSGPGTSTDRAIPTYNGTAGDTLRDTTVGIDVNGNITLASGDTVDGRELSTDGAKLDGIASGAEVNTVDSVNGLTDTVVLDTDDISDSGHTNKWATAAEKTKAGYLTVTQAVDLDTIENDTATNNAKVSNATHTGQVTGSTSLTVDKTAITGQTDTAPATGDSILLSDVSDSGNLIEGTVAQVLALITGLTVGQGGTGQSTLGDAGVLIGNGTSGVNVTGAGTAGQVLTSGGAGVDPTFQAAPVTLTNTATLTNKRISARTGTTTSSGTPTINTDNYDLYIITAQAADITSMTSGLSGTPATGDYIDIWITGTGARAITWGASWASGAATLPTTTITTKTLYTRAVWDGSIWRCMATGSNP